MSWVIQHLLFSSYKLQSPPDQIHPGPLLAESSQMPYRTHLYLQPSLEKVF